MNNDDEYYIPEKIGDEFLRSLAAMAKDVLKEKVVLQDILQKYVVAYNKTPKERCSAKSLKVMNQNHKLIFSTKTSSGEIKSPRCSSGSAKKDPIVSCIINNQLRTPLKTNRISSSTERKRLSFDVADNGYMKPVDAITEYSDGDQVRLDTSASFSKFEEAKLYDSPEEKFNLDGIPEFVATLPIYDQDPANLSIKTPDKDQTMAITPKKKNRTPVNCIVKEKRNAWNLECRPSFLSYEILPKASDSPDMCIQERYNLQGKLETITSLSIYDRDNEYLTTKTPDNHEMMVTSPEKKNNGLVNYAFDDRKSARCLAVSPSFFTPKKEAKVSNKHNTNEQESFHPDEKHKNVSSLPVNHLKTSCISYKTPEKLQTFDVNVNKEERTPINQILEKKVRVKIATNDKERLSPMKEVNTSNNPKMKKWKSVDYSEAIMATSLVTEDQEFMIPSKISEINELTTNDEKFIISTGVLVMKGNDSICSTDEFPMHVNNSFDYVDNFAMDSNETFNCPDFIVDQNGSQSDGKFIMSPVSINNNCESMSVSPAKKYDTPTYQASIAQDCASLFSPESDQKKIAVEAKSDIINSKHDKIKISAHETKDVELLTTRMQNISPSVKHSSDGIFQKSMTNGSVDDDATLVGKLHLRDNLSKTAKPPREFLISNEPSPKPDDSYAIQAVKFIETLKHRKSRFSMYLHSFTEDQHDLKFIYAYLEKLADVIKEIPVNENNEVLMEAVSDFAHKDLKLLDKATSWESDIVKDLEVWEDCIQKTNKIQQDIKHFCRERKRDMTPKDFQKFEASFRILNKRADDMTLLREIRRPTIIQFGYEIENLIKLFIQIMLAVGLLKHSPRVSSD